MADPLLTPTPVPFPPPVPLRDMVSQRNERLNKPTVGETPDYGKWLLAALSLLGNPVGEAQQRLMAPPPPPPMSPAPPSTPPPPVMPQMATSPAVAAIAQQQVGRDVFSPEGRMVGPGRFVKAGVPTVTDLRGAAGAWAPTDPATPAQVEETANNPWLAMQQILLSRGIDPSSPVGRHLASKTDELRQLHDYLSPGEVGKVSYGKQQLYQFLQGYVDMMTSRDADVQRELTQQRGMMRAQVNAALTTPGSDIYDVLGTLETSPEGIPDGQGGKAFGPEIYWVALIGPAMRALGANSHAMTIAKAQFNESLRRYNLRRFNGEQLDFRQYLNESGFTIPI